MEGQVSRWANPDSGERQAVLLLAQNLADDLGFRGIGKTAQFFGQLLHLGVLQTTFPSRASSTLFEKDWLTLDHHAHSDCSMRSK
jgi:hypothetical protein